MKSASLEIRFANLDAFNAEFVRNLCHGGTFVRGVADYSENEACVVSFVHPNSGEVITFPATVVWVVPTGDDRGVGIAIRDFNAEIRDQIRCFFQEGEAASERPDKPKDAKRNLSPQERLRGLSTTEQLKVARGGVTPDRIVLERLYGKTVWEPILRNPRVTVPEVARIANMGALPKHLFELIGSNTAWIRVPQIRRALLGNPKSPPQVVDKVLRVAPRSELRLIVRQSNYARVIRDKAKRLLMNE
jgi:Tfp pilus assembly protein PilZ